MFGEQKHPILFTGKGGLEDKDGFRRDGIS